MKVLQINSVCGVGSTGRIATDIHSLLQEQGHESWIAYGRGEAKNCDKTIKIGNELDNYLHVAKTRVSDKHGFGSKKATEVFIEKIKKLNPDVIHLHNIHGYYINVEILFKYLKTLSKPVIWTLHDCWPFTGHCTYFEYADCNCWKMQGNQKCIQKRSYPTSLLLNNSKKNFARKMEAFTGVKNLTIITPSMWLAKIVKQSFLKEYPIKVINNGISLETFKPTKNTFKEKYNLENKFMILGVAGDWEQRKGFKYFFELADLISSEEKIVMVGLTEKQLKLIPKNIIGLKRTNSTEELVEIYSSADVFVNPTLEDNFPTTNLEALACGTPVITFNTGGSIESIDSKCGIIVEKEKTEELWKNLKKIKKNNFLENNCVERAELYNKDIKFNEYITLYNQVYN